ncbi:PTS sugar transporter subunit IIA [Mameliella sediminis]|uniref:PTS sugar transporter subunit IIA n=1 Tax=Mameliella sediminis TaxID=2836866 RepID=UPI001C47ECB6|nr:PTS sugar transporter subunit IIA [Mameliella sediminis]MBY6113798.1 PTS sugar transporter subunit IIA [Antarctobacter heliothermus]MBY6142854.1 PTS sugar transporter subunit IIA [Mameliella alba]MBV7395095.1 PTS sugar transporter subunit IIA [Mameliella sediminis]MBY6159709.1 PTS sugar transporter subunit IIA [Mameliella alba]MBY6168180.1 PTS sugar transporter subunit IIA [Mameliella alba]
MKFVELISPNAVKVVSATSSKKRLMHDLSDLAESAYDLDAPRILEALMEREALGPTGVGHGVALPHARVPGLDQVVGAFILLEKPVDFDSVDRQPVDVVFALFAPEEAGVEHLKALALVSRSLRDPALCAKLRANPVPATLYTILTEAEAEKAA